MLSKISNQGLIMLSKIPNRRKIYYKITNQEENHHGLQ